MTLALKRVGSILLSVVLLTGMTAFYKPWLLLGELVSGPYPARKVVILISLFGGPALALLAVALAIYYAVTGRKGVLRSFEWDAHRSGGSTVIPPQQR